MWVRVKFLTPPPPKHTSCCLPSFHRGVSQTRNVRREFPSPAFASGYWDSEISGSTLGRWKGRGGGPPPTSSTSSPAQDDRMTGRASCKAGGPPPSSPTPHCPHMHSCCSSSRFPDLQQLFRVRGHPGHDSCTGPSQLPLPSSHTALLRSYSNRHHPWREDGEHGASKLRPRRSAGSPPGLGREGRAGR